MQLCLLKGFIIHLKNNNWINVLKSQNNYQLINILSLKLTKKIASFFFACMNVMFKTCVTFDSQSIIFYYANVSCLNITQPDIKHVKHEQGLTEFNKNIINIPHLYVKLM